MSSAETNTETSDPLEKVLSTQELNTRPSRPPDYEAESRALGTIAQHMADSPGTTLQKLVEVALEVCRAGSAGVSLLSEKTGDFYWPAIAGAWQPNIGGGTPRNFGPCGVVLDRNAVQLFTHPERYFPYLAPVSPSIEEALLTPFYVEGKPVGTVWVIAHETTRKFDSEDVRLMESLGRFAAAIYPLRTSLDALEEQSQSLRDINQELLVSSLRQHELTEQAEKAERATLRESEIRFRFMAESMPQKIFTATSNGEVDYFNRQWMEFTGLSFEQIKNWGWTQFVHPDDVDENIRLWQQSVDSGEPFEFVQRFRRADGVYRWHLSRAHAMRDASSGISMWIGSNTDIHEEREREEELRRANEDLKQFAFAASHDFQEPLRMITSYSQLLLKGYRGQLDGEAAVCVDFISEGTKRMRELLADLLNYTEAGSNQPDADESIDLNLVFQKASQNLKTAIEESEATITSDPLPAIQGRTVHFVQLFQNLIGNAIKYRGELPPQIHVSAKTEKGGWLFSVSDNGMGIDPDYHQQIFGVFKRLHGKAISGTGIGLAICQRVVERYGGRIWVESELGHGSTFYFTLPLRARRKAMTSELASQTFRVLLVEDNPADVYLLKQALKGAGLSVELTVIEDGAEALAFVKRQGQYSSRPIPDLAVLDLNLPKNGGAAVLEAMRQNQDLSRVPVAIMSSTAAPREQARTKELGIGRFITKPPDLEEFLQIGQVLKDMLLAGTSGSATIDSANIQEPQQ